MATAGRYRYPHSVAAVLQQLRLTLGADAMRAVGDTAALLDDRDRWVEDNFAALGLGAGGASAVVPAGAMMDFAGAVAPEGWLLCDGAAVLRADNPKLFEAIGILWGAGDGTTTFNVPDFRGRATIGSGTGTGLTARTVGQTGGEEAHALSANENAAHSHGNVYSSAAGGSFTAQISGLTSAGITANSGSGTPHNNMPPYAVTLKIIKAG